MATISDDFKKAVRATLQIEDTEDVDFCITYADDIIDGFLSGKNLTEKKLELIRKLLSAHFYTLSDGDVKFFTVGNSSTTYKGENGEFFKQTRFGETAIAIDDSETLINMGKRKPKIHNIYAKI